MALKKAYILPHSPLLIPEVGKANYSFLAKTVEAYQSVAAELKKSQIDTLIIVSPHGLTQDQALTINIAPEMTANFQDFGFIPPKTVFSGDTPLADKIKQAIKENTAIQMISTPVLDYGSAIPAYLLKGLIGDFKIITISPAGELSLEDHFAFGEKLKAALSTSTKNIALIASADLSHRLKRKSPGGYSPKGAKFDNKLIEYLSEVKTVKANILKMDANLIKDAGECGLKPICIVLGAVAGQLEDSKVLAYQTDFGIGYLSLELNLYAR